MTNPYESPPTAAASSPLDDGIIELTTDVSASPYYNPDVAPTTRAQRKWGTRDIAALWVGMCACIPSYTLASGLIASGMNWSEAVITVTLGNLIILVPMCLNAHAGTRFGIPFPVYCRVSFGVRGANVAAMLRALVACGWFGIQTWIGGMGFYLALSTMFPALADSPEIFDGANAAQLGCFSAFWLLSMFVIYLGMESIRWFMNVATPILIVVPLALLWWAIDRAGGIGPIAEQPSAFAPGGAKEGQFWKFFFPALTSIVGFWSTLALNIPDFTRFAKSQRAQVLGQVIGLPTTMGLYALIGVLVTSATVVIFKEAIWDPLLLLARFKDNPAVLVLAMLALTAATLSTNIAANVVGPANDFANLLPKLVSFRTGGLITGVIGILLRPWKLATDPSGYIFTWLIAYSALLGAICGILIVDYFFIRKRWIDLPALYERGGKYWYVGGFNLIALGSFVAGVAVCLPGFLGTVGAVEISPDSIWIELYHYAWFLSFGVAGTLYGVLMKVTKRG